ncbi:MAG: hypothetical protein VX733_15570 [Candidatus Latescibacterota bacterium]|nr:hypothetical protein [Candidatus Latescibacterota bacterium]
MNRRSLLLCISLTTLVASPLAAQHSVARQWNEALLHAIRIDFARPTVHARNLFHTSVAMYDAWAAYDAANAQYFLGQTVGGFHAPFEGVAAPSDVDAARDEAIAYVAYRLLSHRFRRSPGAERSLARFDALMAELGHEADYTSTDYRSGPPAALGNYIAEQFIAFGLKDGSNEQGDYANLHYNPFNPPLAPTLPGNRTALDPNFWQPLSFWTFVDQSSNEIAPPFLSAEWGAVVPFALSEEDLTVFERLGETYPVYHDPGPPAHMDRDLPGAHVRHRARSDLRVAPEEYRWGFTLVAVWSAHLGVEDGVMWDISPASIGDEMEMPTTFEGYQQFYDLLDGGDASLGHEVNPHTGEPYEPQIVPRGDYTRVLAEFWADGPDSETPPGHWFTILNYAITRF